MSFELTSIGRSQQSPRGSAARSRRRRTATAHADAHADARADADPQEETWQEIFTALQGLVGHVQSLCCQEPLRFDVALRGAILAAVRETACAAIGARRRPPPVPVGELARAQRALRGLGRVLVIARGRGRLTDHEFLRFRHQAAQVAFGLRLLEAERILGPEAPHPGGT